MASRDTDGEDQAVEEGEDELDEDADWNEEDDQDDEELRPERLPRALP